MAWTRRKAEAWTGDHIEESTGYTQQQHPKWTDHFDGQLHSLENLEWTGHSFEGSREHGIWNKSIAYNAAVTASEAAVTMKGAKEGLQFLQRALVDACTGAELPFDPEDEMPGGFKVTDKFGVEESAFQSYPNEAFAEMRQAQAEAHSSWIQYHLTNFQGALADHAMTIRAHAAELDGTGFPGDGVKMGSGHIDPAVSSSSSGGQTSYNLGGVPIQAPAMAGGGGAKATMVDNHTFKMDPPTVPSQPVTGGGAGGAPVGGSPSRPGHMGIAPPTVIGPGAKLPDPGKHDPRPGELEEDTGKVAAGIGGDLLLPEAAGVKGPLSIGEDLLNGNKLKPGDGMRVAVGGFGGFELAKDGWKDAMQTNPPEMKPDIIDNFLHDRPHFWDEPPNLPPGAKEVK